MEKIVYVFKWEDQNPRFATYIAVENGIGTEEAIGNPERLAGPIIDLMSQGYQIILDRMPNGKRAKINIKTKMDLGALLA